MLGPQRTKLGLERTLKRWSTAELPVPAQFEFWREVICQSFVPLRPERIADGRTEPAFRCSLTTWESSDLLFARVSGQSQRVYRDERDISAQQPSVYFLNIQAKGQAQIEQHGRTTALSPGSFALLDSTAPFRMQLSPSFEQLSIKIPKARLSHLLLDPDTALAHRVESSSGLGRLIVEAFQGVARESEYLDEAETDLAVKHALALTACALNRAQVDHPTQRNGRVQSESASRDARYRIIREKALIYLWQHLEDPQLDVESLSSAIGFSRRYIQAAFSAAQSSVGRWILDQRLDLCREDLLAQANSEQLIASIAFRRGFNDLSYFNRAFKHKFGLTPSAARARRFAIAPIPGSAR